MFLSCLQGLINFLDLPFRVLHPLTPVYFLHLSTTVFLHKPFLSGEWQCLVYPTGLSILPPSQKSSPSLCTYLLLALLSDVSETLSLTIPTHIHGQSILCISTSQLGHSGIIYHPLPVCIPPIFIPFNSAQNASSLKATGFIFVTQHFSLLTLKDPLMCLFLACLYICLSLYPFICPSIIHVFFAVYSHQNISSKRSYENYKGYRGFMWQTVWLLSQCSQSLTYTASWLWSVTPSFF